MQRIWNREFDYVLYGRDLTASFEATYATTLVFKNNELKLHRISKS